MADNTIVYPNITKIDENATKPSKFTQHFPLLGRRVYTDLRAYADDKPKNLPAGEYGLYIGLFKGETPVLLGLDPNRRENDLYYLCNVTVVE